jgi:transcription antitermination factor NusG
MKAWYCLRTRPCAEYRVARNLERVGVEVFFPRVLTARPRRGYADSPLFPGYLFVRLDLGGVEGSPLRVPGARGLVRFGGGPAPVPEEVVEALRRRVEEVNGGGGLWRRYAPGEEVLVRMGPGEVVARVLTAPSSPRQRVALLVHFLGRWVHATAPWEALRPLTGRASAPTPLGRPPRRTRGRGRWVRGFGPRALEASPG